MNAKKSKIQGIFDVSWYLNIPFFQRSYVWGEEQWERFLTDMEDICQYKQEYFLGSVILKKESEEDENKIVVDGQQRLTTLVLFFKVLALMQDKNSDFDRFFKNYSDHKPILQHNKNDRRSFEMILNLGSLQTFDKPANKIEKCYHYFIENINKEALNLADLLSYITFAVIELENYENEQQIFDTINNFGVDLTTADLLKNQFFKNNEITLYEKYWQEVFEKDKETIDYWHINTSKKEKKTLIDMFLFSFLLIKIKDFSGTAKNDFGQISKLLKSYKTIIPFIQDKDVFFCEMANLARIFKENINPNIAKERLRTQIDRINLIIFEGGLFSVIPYFVFILTYFESNPQKRDETLFVLESYLMRRMVGIDKSTFATKLYHDLFGSYLIMNDISSANALKYHFNSYKINHLNSVPTNNDIMLLLKNKSQIQSKALLVLYLLDNKIRQDKGLDPLFGFDKYSVEYLMPIKWQKYWEQPIDMEMRKIAVKTLGNITITPQKLSISLKDADWQTRLNGKGKAKGLLDYNNFYLAKSLLHREKWTDDDIFKNNERLAKIINETWKLN